MAELFLAGVFLGPWSHETVLAEDARDRADAGAQAELVVEAFGPEAGLAALADDDALVDRSGLVGAVVRTFGAFRE